MTDVIANHLLDYAVAAVAEECAQLSYKLTTPAHVIARLDQIGADITSEGETCRIDFAGISIASDVGLSPALEAWLRTARAE